MIPQDYDVSVKSGFASFDSVSATFQKKTQDASELRVQIISDGDVKKEQTTTAAFGVVSVSWATTEG